MLIVITHSVIKAMLDKFALKFNKCALNVEIDMKKITIITNGLNMMSMSNQSQKACIFFIHHQHFDYKTWK